MSHPAVCFDVCVLHAPTSSSGSGVIHSFWDEATKVRRSIAQSNCLFVLADVNGRIGSADEHVGTVAMDEEDVSGRRFHQFLVETNTFATNTFQLRGRTCEDRIEHGAASHTFMASNGTMHRIDYACASCSHMSCVSDVKVHRSIDIGEGRDDHFPVSFRIEVPCGKLEGRSILYRRTPICSRTAMRDPHCIQMFASYLRNIPGVDWNMPTHDHHAYIFKHLQYAASIAFGRGCAPRSPLISHFT